jgi:hypothetical protein
MVLEEWAWWMAQWVLEEVAAASLEVLLQCEGAPQEVLVVSQLDQVVDWDQPGWAEDINITIILTAADLARLTSTLRTALLILLFRRVSL